MVLFKKSDRQQEDKIILPKKPIFQKPFIDNSPGRKQSDKPFIQNSKKFSENNDPTVLKVIQEKIWSMKNIQIALFIGFILLIFDLIIIFMLNSNVLTNALVIILITVIIYAIALYFLLNPPSQKTVEKEKIRNIEKPTIKIVEKPVEKIKYIERPIIKKVTAPISIPINKNPMKTYPYVASTKSKKIHATHTTAGRMIKPENREFAHDIKDLTAKGYSVGRLSNNSSKKKTSSKKKINKTAKRRK